MYLLEKLPEPAIKLIFKYADIESCINLHNLVNISEYMWRKKIAKLYNKEPEKLICTFAMTKHMMFAYIYAGTNINTKNYYEETALHIACVTGYEDIVELLINRGAEINMKDKDGETALHNASRNGYKKIVELLIDRGANINAMSYFGGTALQVASYYGKKEIVELLKSKGAHN